MTKSQPPELEISEGMKTTLFHVDKQSYYTRVLKWPFSTHPVKVLELVLHGPVQHSDIIKMAFETNLEMDIS